MDIVRTFGAQISARTLLRKLWQQRSVHFDSAVSSEEFLRRAPELLVRNVLNVQLEYKEVASNEPGMRVAGFVDRPERRIVVAPFVPQEWQRFTLAHEIGHWMLHTGQRHFRERPMEGIDFQSLRRPPKEKEADIFAAELLMPKRHLKESFLARFGSEVNGKKENLPLTHSLSEGFKRRIDPDEFCAMTPAQRAVLLARAPYFLGKFFAPLSEQYAVSPTAMAIQLLQTKLVS